MPVTRPVAGLIRTTPVPVPHTLHVPPVVALLSDVVVPGQSSNVPVIAAGSGVTVTVAIARQPVVAV